MPNDKLLDWTIHKAKTEFHDDISIMIEKNQNYLERDRDVRFVNKFVSSSKSLIGLARTFIINGIGYDLMQYSWEDMERHAQVDYYCGLIADAKLVYYKTEADKERFEALRQKFHQNLSDKKFMQTRALEWFKEALNVYTNMLFEESLCAVRKAAGYIVDYLSWSVAACNQRYFSLWVLNQVEELEDMERLPKDFLRYYRAVVQAKSVEEYKDILCRIVALTRTFLQEEASSAQDSATTEDNGYWLKEWYEEGSYYFRRIYHYCEQENAEVVFMLCSAMQAELDEIKRDFKIENTDILTGFDADDLFSCMELLKSVEQSIVDRIKSDGYVIEIYDSVDEFIEKNP